MTFQYNSLVTSSTSADQVIVTFTPLNTTSWKYIGIVGTLQTYNGSDQNLGVVSLQVDGSTIFSARIQHTPVDSRPGIISIPLGNGITFNGSQVVRWIVTPASSTSMEWRASFLGQG